MHAPPDPDPDAGDIYRDKTVELPYPSKDDIVLHVCVDVETANPIPIISEVWEVALQPFAVETMRTGAVTFIEEPCMSRRIQPSGRFAHAELF